MLGAILQVSGVGKLVERELAFGASYPGVAVSSLSFWGRGVLIYQVDDACAFRDDNFLRGPIAVEGEVTFWGIRGFGFDFALGLWRRCGTVLCL